MHKIGKTTRSMILCGAAASVIAMNAANAGPKFLYTLHNNQALRGFSINPTTGALTAVAGSPWIVPEFPTLFSMGAAPGGKFLYPVTPYSSVTSGYAVNVNNGSLTAVPGSPFAFPPDGISLAVHPNGQLAYLSATAYEIWPFTVNQTTGKLTASGNVASGGVYPRLAIEPNGKCLYSINRGIFFINDPAKTNNISAFNINQSTGGLTETAGSPFSTGNYPAAFAFHPSGKYLVVSSSTSSDLRTYAIDANTCALTQKATLKGASGDVVFELTGHFMYATAGGTARTIATLSFNATTGALTRSGTVTLGKLSASRLAMDPQGKFLFAIEAGSGATIQAAAYTINPTTGALKLSSGPTAIDGDSPVMDLAIAGTP